MKLDMKTALLEILCLLFCLALETLCIPLQKTAENEAFNPLTKSALAGKVQNSKTFQQKLPTALIIGVKKGGTRALLEILRLNPLVKAPGPEIHFFDRHYNRGLDWYRRQMPATTENQLLLEKTPSYFVTRYAPSRIAQMNPEIKLIVVVRDPVSRAISDYTQTSSKRPGMPSFEALAFANDSSVNTSWGAVKVGIYERYIKRWLTHFPLKQLHFVSGERLISHPAEETRLVENFLNLPNFITEKHFRFNSTKGFPCLLKNRTQKPHCLGKTKGRQHPRLPVETIDKLRNFFRPLNERFYELVGRNFKW